MLEKQIHDILTNGRADTAAERIASMVRTKYERATTVLLCIESRVSCLVDGEVKAYTPMELVDILENSKKTPVALWCVLSAIVGSGVTYLIMEFLK